MLVGFFLFVTGGTLAYTGSGETVAGLSLDNAKTGCAVLDVANDLTLLSLPVNGSGPFLKMGAGELRFKGTDTFYCGNYYYGDGPSNTTDSVVAPNGDGPINTIMNFSIGEGRVVVGTKDDPNDAPNVIVSSQIAVGLHAGQGASPELVLNNGTITAQKKDLRIGWYDTLGEGVRTPSVTVNGGILSISGYVYMTTGYAEGAPLKCSPAMTINGGEVTVGNQFRMGYSMAAEAGLASTLTVNGGSLTVGDLYLGYLNSANDRTTDCTVNLNGGLTTVTNELCMSRNGVATSTLNLNEGAVLKVGSIVSTRAGGTFKFNGGTLVLTGTGSTDANTTFLVGAKGAVISTAEAPDGKAVLEVVLRHDPSLGDAPDGGLVKKGPGTLVISTNSTFTGSIVVEEGAVIGGGCDVGETGNVTLAAGSVIGCYGNPGEWYPQVQTVEGNLTAEGNVYIDFGRTAANPVHVGEIYPIAVVKGTALGPTGKLIKFRMLDPLPGLTLETVFADGILAVRVESKGLMFLIR